MIEIFNGNSFNSLDAKANGIKWLKIANIGIGVIKWDIESYLPFEFWNKFKAYQVHNGDYVVALTRPILNHELKISQLQEDDTSLLNQRVGKLIFKENSDYAYQLLRKRNIVDYIEKTISGTDPPNLSSNSLNLVVADVPNEKEQNKIGKFLLYFDKTIASNQRHQKKPQRFNPL